MIQSRNFPHVPKELDHILSFSLGLFTQCQPFSLKFVCSKGPTVTRAHDARYYSCVSALGGGGRGAPLCGPPPRRSLERGGIAVRAALAACQNGSRCCATSLGRRTRAQRNRSRRKRSTFLWGARCARGPPGLPSAEFHDDGDTCDSLYEYQGERNFSSSSGSLCEHMVYEGHTENMPHCTQRDPTLCKKRVCELEEKQWRTDRDESGSESMTEYVAPAPAVYYATPAPPIEFVTPSPVTVYSAPAPSVTCFTPSATFVTKTFPQARGSLIGENATTACARCVR